MSRVVLSGDQTHCNVHTGRKSGQRRGFQCCWGETGVLFIMDPEDSIRKKGSLLWVMKPMIILSASLAWFSQYINIHLVQADALRLYFHPDKTWMINNEINSDFSEDLSSMRGITQSQRGILCFPSLWEHKHTVYPQFTWTTMLNETFTGGGSRR